jgi:26S proteasome regulatory subunit N6
VQSLIDAQSGILHAEEKDYKTAYSYFFEAFEQMHALSDPKAVLPLKYMLLCKVMCNSPEDVAALVSAKGGLAYQGPDLDAMKAVATASAERSLASLQSALERYKPQLASDAVIAQHLESLYDTLLERNLVRLIEPFSRVELAHVAQLIALPLETVERKLSQMILDKQFLGTLDQGQGCLLVYEADEQDGMYGSALETIANLGRVVDALAVKQAAIRVG